MLYFLDKEVHLALNYNFVGMAVDYILLGNYSYTPDLVDYSDMVDYYSMEDFHSNFHCPSNFDYNLDCTQCYFEGMNWENYFHMEVVVVVVVGNNYCHNFDCNLDWVDNNQVGFDNLVEEVGMDRVGLVDKVEMEGRKVGTVHYYSCC